MKTIFGREPAVWIGAVGTILTALAAFIPGLSPGWASAVTAFVSALVMAWATRPASPAVFTGVVAAGAALLGEYGLHLSDAQVGTLSAAVLAVFALVVRTQVSPDTPRLDR